MKFNGCSCSSVSYLCPTLKFKDVCYVSIDNELTCSPAAWNCSSQNNWDSETKSKYRANFESYVFNYCFSPCETFFVSLLFSFVAFLGIQE